MNLWEYKVSALELPSLNLLGAEGWEVCGVFTTGVILKRPIAHILNPTQLPSIVREKIEEFCKKWEIGVRSFYEVRSKNPRIFNARRDLFLFLRDRGWTYTKTAQAFNLDHTSIRYVCLSKEKKVD